MSVKTLCCLFGCSPNVSSLCTQGFALEFTQFWDLTAEVAHCLSVDHVASICRDSFKVFTHTLNTNYTLFIVFVVLLMILSEL